MTISNLVCCEEQLVLEQGWWTLLESAILICSTETKTNINSNVGTQLRVADEHFWLAFGLVAARCTSASHNNADTWDHWTEKNAKLTFSGNCSKISLPWECLFSPTLLVTLMHPFHVRTSVYNIVFGRHPQTANISKPPTPYPQV